MPAMVTSGSSCEHCECPCAYDFTKECYISAPCANPICSSYLDECYLFKSFKSEGYLHDPNAWVHERFVDFSMKGLMSNLAPHYWPVRLNLPKDEIMSFQEIVDREKLADDAAVAASALGGDCERIVEIREPAVCEFIVPRTGPMASAKSRFQRAESKNARGPYKKKAGGFTRRLR
jgi:hypothetical protein